MKGPMPANRARYVEAESMRSGMSAWRAAVAATRSIAAQPSHPTIPTTTATIQLRLGAVAVVMITATAATKPIRPSAWSVRPDWQQNAGPTELRGQPKHQAGDQE